MLRDSMIRDALILGMRDHRVRECLLKEQDLSLDKAINIARAIEQAQTHAKALYNEDTGDMVMKVQPYPNKDLQCKFCGRKHPWGRSKCPAFGKTFNNCCERNHFSKVCKKPSRQEIKLVSENSDKEDEFIIQ